MSSVSGMRESSSSSTVTRQVPSPSCSSPVTDSASRPVMSASSSRARAAISAPAERARRLRLRSWSAIWFPLLGLGAYRSRRLGALDLLLEDLALDLRGLVLADLAALALLLDLVDLLHAGGRAELLALGLLGDLLRDPDGEAQRCRRK